MACLGIGTTFDPIISTSAATSWRPISWGINFRLLRDFFVFHMGQSGLDNNGPNIPLKEQEKNWKFHEYLATSYGLPLSGKFVSFVSEEEILL
jgi:hypothetical protein